MLPKPALIGLREEILQLYNAKDDSDPFFQVTGQDAHRSDLTGFIGISEAKEQGLHHMPEVIQMLLEELPEALHSYQIEHQDTQHRALTRILPPPRCMLSVYQDGALYKPHRDGVRHEDQGVIGGALAMSREYLNHGSKAALVHMATLSTDIAQREITAILYLNDEDWDVTTDGGALRIFTGTSPEDLDGTTATIVEDIAPVGGRLVVFRSRDVLHTVLPAHRQRLAMTAWFLNEEAVIGQRTAASIKQYE
jgi:hypothetical protein